MAVIKILIVDDHEVVRIGLKTALASEQDFQIIGEAATGQAALDFVREQKPDVVVLDVRLPDISGIEVCREIRSHYDNVHILMLTNYGEDESVYAAVLAGASAFLLKDINLSSLIETIHAIHTGKVLLDLPVVSRLLTHLQPENNPKVKSALTPREQEILKLMAQGKTNKEIAATLILSESTVKNHISNVLGKLNLGSRSQAVAYYYKKQQEPESS
ncbi:transcriptional regulatory protein DevR (DosR) [Peptococcaceae bacterium CEB3]|nr:transcriptional regulatory protein DevR (DosR) [Peptococcaceae bacterium CEB3]